MPQFDASFHFIAPRPNQRDPKPLSPDSFLLSRTGWDDFGFGTTFQLFLPVNDSWLLAGVTKIGHVGQESRGVWGTTQYTELPETFTALGENYFSVGQDAGLYSSLVSQLGPTRARELLVSLRDMTAVPDLLDAHFHEVVVQQSLFRTISARSVRDQYERILMGGSAQEEFTLEYRLQPSVSGSPVMTFTVDPTSVLPTNVHVIIGSNGTGKTTALQNIRAELGSPLIEMSKPRHFSVSDASKISSLVSVSFSAFDLLPNTYRSPSSQTDFKIATIGLSGTPHTHEDGVARHFTDSDIRESGLGQLLTSAGSAPGSQQSQQSKFREAVNDALKNRKERLSTVLSILADADLVLDARGVRDPSDLSNLHFATLSSGHKIVLLTMVNLVRYCEERSLILIDEPESHLHPPLIGAFTRALSWLMTQINGLAIVATHSPVVLQEVPRACSWRIWSSGIASNVDQPEIETFGENVGVLTRHVFGLELDKSGYHAVLAILAERYGTYEEALHAVNGQLGNEAKLLLRAMIARNQNTSS